VWHRQEHLFERRRIWKFREQRFSKNSTVLFFHGNPALTGALLKLPNNFFLDVSEDQSRHIFAINDGTSSGLVRIKRKAICAAKRNAALVRPTGNWAGIWLDCLSLVLLNWGEPLAMSNLRTLWGVGIPFYT